MSNEKALAFEKVKASMSLRTPQLEALEIFHKILQKAEGPLSAISRESIIQLFKSEYPEWDYDHDCLEFTFHLATGVGKTRLIGSLIAYLYLAGESKNFMIISPRTEIVRKFIKVCISDGNDYIFVDPWLIDFPTIYDNTKTVSDYSQGGMFDNGPRIWILSPQAFSAQNSRMKKKGEHDRCSAVEYLRELNDLVIFFDESHHLGFDAENDSEWRSELHALEPQMLIGTTASVSENQNNVLYSYDLKKCLNEHLYTKFVKIIPNTRPEAISDEDFDHLTLRFALQRLDYKQRCIDEYCRINNLPNCVKATMLVACENIDQAEKTTLWLRNYLGNKDAVLLVHSRLKESEYLPRLQKLEDVNNPARVVVNVSMLNEGWDVSNIYVISPLRAMASSTLVTQIMGRGLRLPFGNQVGNEEVDTLDVLCFGNETLQEILDSLINQGFGVNSNRGISVDDDPVRDPAPDVIPHKKINLHISGDFSELHIPQFQMRKETLPLDSVSIPPLKPQDLHYFLMNDLTSVKNLQSTLEFERLEFIRMVATDIFKQCSFLTYSRQYNKIINLIDRFLCASRFPDGNVKLDPSRVVAHIKESLEKLNRQQAVSYIKLEEDIVIDLTHVQISVPETYEKPFNCHRAIDWNSSVHKGIPFSGWTRAAFVEMPFDTPNELKIAKIIDTADVVKWWFRNLPGILTLTTPAGKYSPDFAIFLNCTDKNILLEIKDDDRFGREDQDATIKANAARAWCKAQSEATGIPWQYWLLLDSDARDCETFEDIEDNSDIDY